MMNPPEPATSAANDTVPGASGPSPLRRAGDAVRSMLGLHRRFVVDGVRYTECSAEPLRRALSRRGSGRKDYDVLFADRTTMRIRATASREYADISGARLAPVYALVERVVRPGMRVLDAGAGTGYGAAWLVERVGPSGAVVALERDQESVRYALARYGRPNAAFEQGWLDSLAGETDGAFDGVVCCDALRVGDDAAKALRELWRLVGPGGWLLLATPGPAGDGRPESSEGPRAFTPAELIELVRVVIGAPNDPTNSKDGGPTEPGAAPTDTGGRLVILVQRPDR